MSVGRFLQQAAAGNTGDGAVYTEDVFSTDLYTGTGSAETITNNINLSGEGGMVWLKQRTNAPSYYYHQLTDTVRGKTYHLSTNTSDAEGAVSVLSSFNSDGYTAGSSISNNGTPVVGWTFRNQPGFFEVHTYTGTGSSQTINHTLGCKPGMVIVKRRDATSHWGVYTRNGDSDSEVGIGYLNKTDAFTTGSLTFSATSSIVRIFSNSFSFDATTSGGAFVVYLFAMGGIDTAANVFGEDSDQPIIKCGTYTASAGTSVDVGFEPQWILTKSVSSSSSDWYLFDTMRDWHADQGSSDKYMSPNILSGDGSTTNSLGLHPKGFYSFNGGGQTYWYMAIRRPNKPASKLTASDMFAPVLGTSTSDWIFDAGFPVDLHFYTRGSNNRFVFDRLRGDKYFITNSTATAADTTFTCDFDYMNYCDVASSTISGWMTYNFKRTPEFFDIVHRQSGLSGSFLDHNLGVVPEFIISRRTTGTGGLGGALLMTNIKGASTSSTWGRLDLNRDVGTQNNFDGTTLFTSTTFYTGYLQDTTDECIYYLFASSPGISKIGTYTGTGSDLNVNCGFSSGARFVLVKRVDSNGSWYLWDSVRGIVSGNDPYFLVEANTTITTTDYIDPLSSGFTITSTAPAELNASGGTYAFLAIA